MLDFTICVPDIFVHKNPLDFGFEYQKKSQIVELLIITNNCCFRPAGCHAKEGVHHLG